MKIRFDSILFLISMCVITGCSHHTEQEENILAETNDVTSVEEYGLEELREKYPEWIDNEGNIQYPYNLNSKEHQNADSYQELCKLYDIPKEIVDHTETEKLLRAVEEYPLLNFSLYDTFKIATENYNNNFYAYMVLQSRSDANQAAWDSFQQKQENQILNSQDELQQRAEINKIILDESLLLTKSGNKQFNDEEKKEILTQVKSLHNQIEDIGEKLGLRVYGLDEMVSDSSWEI